MAIRMVSPRYIEYHNTEETIGIQWFMNGQKVMDKRNFTLTSFFFFF